MKKTFTSFFAFKAAAFLLLGIALIVYSCTKEITTSTTPIIADSEIATAKAWYQITYPVNTAGHQSQHTNDVGNNTDLSQKISPDWQRPSKYKRLNKDVIEMPLDPSDKFNSALQNKATNRLITNKDYSRSSFILLKNGTGYDAYVMTIIADSAYLKGDPNKLARNTYSKHDTDFSGYVLYFTPKGEYVSGFRYLSGHLVLPQTQSESSSNQQVQSVVNSKIKPTTVPTIACWDYWLVGYSHGIADTWTYLFTMCESEDGGGGIGGNEGGGGGAIPNNSCVVPSGTHSVNSIDINNVPPEDPGDGGYPPPDPCPTTPPPLPPGNPCAQKAKVSATAANATVKQHNTQILANTISTGHEYGSDLKLTSLTGTTYKNTAVTTNAATGIFQSSFSWNATNGYSVGVNHGHPGGSAPSPADALWPINNIALVASNKKQFYKDNVSVTTVTATATYVITVKNWTALQNLYNAFYANTITFNANYVQIANQHQNSTEYALLSIFGNAINLYKASGTSTAFKPLIINSNNVVATKPCP